MCEATTLPVFTHLNRSGHMATPPKPGSDEVLSPVSAA